MDLGQLGFIRTAAVSPVVELADPKANAERIYSIYGRLCDEECSVVLTPELSLTGYSCEDLFFSDELLGASNDALAALADKTGAPALVVGAPIQLSNGRMYNCAVVCANGQILGAVPKSFIPTHNEFYEHRWFDSGIKIETNLAFGSHEFTLCSNQGFQLGDTTFAIEICEDLWAPTPPSIDHCLNGALIVLNPSASNELISKVEYRRELVRMQSAKSICAYLYAGCGVFESTKDTVYSGHLIGAENGVVLGESERFSLQGSELLIDFDVRKLQHERRRTTTYRQAEARSKFSVVDCSPSIPLRATSRHYDRQPFVPSEGAELSSRTAEVLEIQRTGLARRMVSARADSLVIGLSGGVDSTLAFLVCIEALQKLDKPNFQVLGATMPGLGTSEHTLQSARQLADVAGTRLMEMDIQAPVREHLDLIQHDGSVDITLENAQSRQRTMMLFDLANKNKGIVVGTGDMSELALGWCTFNGDHMSSYNVNVSVPKTLVAHVVNWYAETRASAELAEVLKRVVETPFSPELVPSSSDEISQQTESILGPYELHDFFLYHFLRTGASMRKLYEIAQIAFQATYKSEEIKRCLTVFCERFFRNQFKRTTLPAGPKVGTVNLSPRGDWRMPDEAEYMHMLESIRDF